MSLFRAELPGQQQRIAASAPAEVLERLVSAGGIDGNGAQELCQLMGAARVEGAIGAAAQPGQLLERRRRNLIPAFVEDEGRQSQDAQLTGEMTEIIDRLLHAIADEDERV